MKYPDKLYASKKIKTLFSQNLPEIVYREGNDN